VHVLQNILVKIDMLTMHMVGFLEKISGTDYNSHLCFVILVDMKNWEQNSSPMGTIKDLSRWKLENGVESQSPPSKSMVNGK
jgi:hypothetical protein